ncbi:MAG: SIMPL domain-containing protein [Thermoprotei archaeon]
MTSQDPNNTTLTIVATGSVSAKPALAQIVFDVQTSSTNLTQALANNNEISAKIVSSLAQLGVGANNLTTLSFTVNPIYYDNGVLEYYQVDNTVLVNISAENTLLVGQVVEVGVESGAQVDQVSFTLSPTQQSQLEKQALSIALANAQQQAEQAASQLGLKILGVEHISIPNVYYQPPIYSPPLSVITTQQPQFFQGQTQYSISIQVVYELS